MVSNIVGAFYIDGCSVYFILIPVNPLLASVAFSILLCLMPHNFTRQERPGLQKVNIVCMLVTG